MKKEVNAARDAPLRRMEMAAGSTPQEHNGKGMPTAADFITDRQPVPAKWRANVFWGPDFITFLRHHIAQIENQ